MGGADVPYSQPKSGADVPYRGGADVPWITLMSPCFDKRHGDIWNLLKLALHPLFGEA